MSEVLSFMVYVGGFIMAIVWIVFPFTVVGLLKEIIAELKLVHWELRKLNNRWSGNEQPSPKEIHEFYRQGRPTAKELEEFLGPGPGQ